MTSSWDAHLDFVCKDAESAVLCSKDGTMWGAKHGACDSASQTELKEASCNARNKCATSFRGEKYLYITEVEGCAGYRSGPKSAAVYEAHGHCGIVFGKDGQRVPDCVAEALKLKKYMESIGQI